MERVHHVEVHADRSIAAGALVWRYRERLHVTAMVKATFSLGLDAPMAHTGPEDLAADDIHAGGAIRRPSDHVPFRRRADVIVRASARPAGRAARVVIQGTDGMLQKALAITDDASVLGPRPGLQLNGPVTDLPDDCDFDLFQRAPADQQLRHLHGDEWIMLEGLHPSIDRLTTRIPGARATGSAEGLAASPGAHPLGLEADALLIDVDELRCTITWRAVLPLVSPVELAKLRLDLGLEIAGHAVLSRRSVDLEGTLDLSAHGASREALPFDRSAKPALPSAPRAGARHPFEGTLDLTGFTAASASAPWWLSPRVEPKRTPMLGETTLTIDDSVAARPMTAPFPLAGAAPPASSKPISGAPWSQEPAPATPAPRADLASTLDLTAAAAKTATGGESSSPLAPPTATPAANGPRPRLFRKLPPKKT